MSRVVNFSFVRPYSMLVWPLVFACSITFLFVVFHLQPVYYFLSMNVSIISSLIASKCLQGSRFKPLAKKSLLVVACLFLLALMIFPTRAAVISEWTINGDPRPHGILSQNSAPNSNVWFTEEIGGRIGYISGSTVTEYNIPTTGAAPWGIVYDPNPDGDDPNANSIWFTESGVGKIGRLKDNVFVEFKLGIAPGAAGGGSPRGITFDYNVSSGTKYKNVWFTEFTGNAIGKISYNASGLLQNRWTLTEYGVPTALQGPLGIARNPVNGLIYFCSYGGSSNKAAIGSFNPWTLTFKQFDVYTALGLGVADRIDAIAIGSDGIVWATLNYQDSNRYDRIIRLDPWSSQITTYEIPTQGSGPKGITVVDDSNSVDNKNVWFTEYDKDKIGRLNPVTGFITEFNLPNGGSNPLCIAKRSGDNSVWFTEWTGNRIGSLDPTSATSMTTVNTITSATTSTAIASATPTQSPSKTATSVVYSTTSFVNSFGVVSSETPIGDFTTAGATITTSTGGVPYTTTVSTNVQYFAGSSTTDTETVYVLPTSTTASTTSIFTSTSTTTTTISRTFSSVVQTIVSSTTTTSSDTFTTPIQTASTFTTIGQVYTGFVSTETQTIWGGGTSYRYTTVTAPFFTQYSTSTLKTTFTTILSTVTTTSTVYSTSTLFTTVTAGIIWPTLLLLAIAGVPTILRYKRRLEASNNRGGN